ncbi:MAG: hypothetical protein D6712_10260 [Chloroflexi bacterium]|nr:MAG: hypothetical protein D6712_10260 [Chloroflexota bacterium]
MSHDLPEFKPLRQEKVLAYLHRVFGEHYVKMDSFPDGHYRVYFKPGYFVIQPGKTEPSKSQWSTLKKRMKRIHPGVFIFKQTGTTSSKDGPVYYIDFGFFAYR